MMHKAWCSIEEVPYCFPRSSIKFQGHKGQKIANGTAGLERAKWNTAILTLGRITKLGWIFVISALVKRSPGIHGLACKKWCLIMVVNMRCDTCISLVFPLKLLKALDFMLDNILRISNLNKIFHSFNDLHMVPVHCILHTVKLLIQVAPQQAVKLLITQI